MGSLRFSLRCIPASFALAYIIADGITAPSPPRGKLAALLVQAAGQFDPDTDTAEDVSDEAERLIDEATAEDDEDSEVTKQRKATDMAEIGIVEICKSIAGGKIEAPSEDTLARLIKKQASAERRAGETEAQAFSRIVTDDSEDGLALRKALQVARGF